jgi:hypothetical protein
LIIKRAEIVYTENNLDYSAVAHKMSDGTFMYSVGNPAIEEDIITQMVAPLRDMIGDFDQ